MTFDQAKQKMSKIANGKYHSLTYELTIFGAISRDKMEAKCRVYLDPSLSGLGNTWAEAFNNLQKEMGISPGPDLEEAPGEEVSQLKEKEEETDG